MLFCVVSDQKFKTNNHKWIRTSCITKKTYWPWPPYQFYLAEYSEFKLYYSCTRRNEGRKGRWRTPITGGRKPNNRNQLLSRGRDSRWRTAEEHKGALTIARTQSGRWKGLGDGKDKEPGKQNQSLPRANVDSIREDSFEDVRRQADPVRSRSTDPSKHPIKYADCQTPTHNFLSTNKTTEEHQDTPATNCHRADSNRERWNWTEDGGHRRNNEEPGKRNQSLPRANVDSIGGIHSKTRDVKQILWEVEAPIHLAVTGNRDAQKRYWLPDLESQLLEKNKTTEEH